MSAEFDKNTVEIIMSSCSPKGFKISGSVYLGNRTTHHVQHELDSASWHNRSIHSSNRINSERTKILCSDFSESQCVYSRHPCSNQLQQHGGSQVRTAEH